MPAFCEDPSATDLVLHFTNLPIINNTVREDTGLSADILVLNPIYADRMGSYLRKYCYEEKEQEGGEEQEDTEGVALNFANMSFNFKLQD